MDREPIFETDAGVAWRSTLFAWGWILAVTAACAYFVIAVLPLTPGQDLLCIGICLLGIVFRASRVVLGVRVFPWGLQLVTAGPWAGFSWGEVTIRIAGKRSRLRKVHGGKFDHDGERLVFFRPYMRFLPYTLYPAMIRLDPPDVLKLMVTIERFQPEEEEL